MAVKPIHDEKEDEFKVYKSRWFVLACVSMMNISINALWIRFDIKSLRKFFVISIFFMTALLQ